MQENHNTNLPQQLLNAKWIVLIKLQRQAVDRSFLWQFPLTVSQSYACVRVSFQVDGTVDASLHSLAPIATCTPGSSDKKEKPHRPASSNDKELRVCVYTLEGGTCGPEK